MIILKYTNKSLLEQLKKLNQLYFSTWRLINTLPNKANVFDITHLLVIQIENVTSTIEELLKEIKDPNTISLYQIKIKEINSVTSLTSIDNQTVDNGVNAGNRVDEGDRDEAQSP